MIIRSDELERIRGDGLLLRSQGHPCDWCPAPASVSLISKRKRRGLLRERWCSHCMPQRYADQVAAMREAEAVPA